MSNETGATGSKSVVKIPSTIRLLLEQIGQFADAHGVSAYAVGGCVRDWLLGIPDSLDLDVAVEGQGIVVARAIGHVLGGSLTVHEQFGTASLQLTGRRGGRVDFASCRKETYARPAAYPKVIAGTMHDDLFRRDFSVNAMAVALRPGQFGRLVDPFHGARDLGRQVLRVLHDRSFLDDPSRLLRGVRFAQRFGLRWERRTTAAARAAIAQGALGWLNAGRLRRELDRMCEEPNPVGCLRQLVWLFAR